MRVFPRRESSSSRGKSRAPGGGGATIIIPITLEDEKPASVNFALQVRDLKSSPWKILRFSVRSTRTAPSFHQTFVVWNVCRENNLSPPRSHGRRERAEDLPLVRARVDSNRGYRLDTVTGVRKSDASIEVSRAFADMINPPRLRNRGRAESGF